MSRSLLLLVGTLSFSACCCRPCCCPTPRSVPPAQPATPSLAVSNTGKAALLRGPTSDATPLDLDLNDPPWPALDARRVRVSGCIVPYAEWHTPECFQLRGCDPYHRSFDRTLIVCLRSGDSSTVGDRNGRVTVEGSLSLVPEFFMGRWMIAAGRINDAVVVE